MIRDKNNERTLQNPQQVQEDEEEVKQPAMPQPNYPNQ